MITLLQKWGTVAKPGLDNSMSMLNLSYSLIKLDLNLHTTTVNKAEIAVSIQVAGMEKFTYTREVGHTSCDNELDYRLSTYILCRVYIYYSFVNPDQFKLFGPKI